MEVAEIDSPELKRASFMARLRRLRVAYHSGDVIDFEGVPHGLFLALTNASNPEAFMRDRVAGRYPSRSVVRAA